MAGKSKFAEEQIQEMRDMRLNQKKTNQEIIQAFKEKYQLDINSQDLWYHCRVVGEKRVVKKSMGGGGNKKNISTPLAAIPVSSGDDVQQAAADILKIILQVREGTRSVVKAIRKELVRSRAEVYLMKKGAGIKIEAVEEEENEGDVKELKLEREN